MNIALITFAGIGSRITSLVPKQFVKIKGQDMVCYTIDTFENHPLIDEIVLVTSKEYLSYVQNMVFAHDYKKVSMVVEGGKTRQESVRLALNKMKTFPDSVVLIHDGDRPLVSAKLITKIIKEKNTAKVVVPVLENKKKEPLSSGAGRKITIKDVLYDVQTPQAFLYPEILEAHNRLKDVEVSDDASLFNESLVKYIPGEARNFKVTTNSDLDLLKEILK